MCRYNFFCFTNYLIEKGIVLAFGIFNSIIIKKLCLSYWIQNILLFISPFYCEISLIPLYTIWQHHELHYYFTGTSVVILNNIYDVPNNNFHFPFLCLMIQFASGADVNWIDEKYLFEIYFVMTRLNWLLDTSQSHFIVIANFIFWRTINKQYSV